MMKGSQFFRKHGIEPFDVYVNYHYAYALYVLYLIAAMQLAEDVEDGLCIDEMEAVILLENLSEAEELMKYYRERMETKYAGFDIAEKITMKGCRLEQGKIVGNAEDAARIAGMWIQNYHSNRVNLFIYEVGIYILLFLQKEIDFSFLARKGCKKMYIMDKDLKLQDWEFSQRKYLPYEIKLRLSATRIRQWYEYYGGDVYISFSGGLDSTVLVHMVERVLDRSIPKVFVDTGLEFPQIREFVRSFYDVEILYPEMNFKDVLLTYGYPLISKEVAAKIRKLRHGNLSERYRNYLLHGDERGKLGKLSECWKFLIDAPFDISEYCCIVMKEKPLTEYGKRTGRVPYIGITQDEGFMRQRQYNRTGCNVYLADKPKSQPLGFWPRQDILRYAVENNLRICPVYGKICGEKGAYYNTGEQRTGCMYCAMGCHLEEQPNRYQRLRENYPKVYRFVMEPMSAGGLGFDYVLNYCNFIH